LRLGIYKTEVSSSNSGMTLFTNLINKITYLKVTWRSKNESYEYPGAPQGNMMLQNSGATAEF
jgi:hypothetical protein